jgi:hypothetical protein
LAEYLLQFAFNQSTNQSRSISHFRIPFLDINACWPICFEKKKNILWSTSNHVLWNIFGFSIFFRWVRIISQPSDSFKLNLHI